MTGIYVRQSLFKKDSLSLPAQIERCKQAAGQDKTEVYEDAGYSGKNTKRPGFQRMMRDVAAGRLNKIICYRIDRISRSVSDFGEIWQDLSAHGVELLSVSEQFDTSTPIGKAMLYIIMVFAQMERETTAQRITDNYYKRASEGAWPGGPAPFGFDLSRQELHGKMQSVLRPNEHIKEVAELFEQYATGSVSLGKLAAQWRENSGGAVPWSNVTIRRILVNPIYVSADADLYAYYNALGVQIINPLQEFDGSRSAMLIGYRHADSRRRRPLEEQKLYLTALPGVVSSEVFVRVQNCLAKNKQIKNSHRSKWSWLSGMLSCGSCGYSLRLTHYPKVQSTKAYLFCSNRYGSVKTCTLRHSERIEDIEAYVEQQILNRIADPPDEVRSQTVDPDISRKLNGLKLQLLDVQSRQKNLVEAISVGGAAAVRLLTPELEHLDAESASISEQINTLNAQQSPWTPNISVDFSRLDTEGKRLVALALIERVIVSPNETKIRWK